MSKNLYIKGICGTNSDPDDLWVCHINLNDFQENKELLLLKQLNIKFNDDASIELIQTNETDSSYLSFHTIISDIQELCNKYEISNTTYFVYVLNSIRALIEDSISAVTDKDTIDTLFKIHKFINNLIITLSIYPDKEFYIE